jgi:hypothetical protein
MSNPHTYDRRLARKHREIFVATLAHLSTTRKILKTEDGFWSMVVWIRLNKDICDAFVREFFAQVNELAYFLHVHCSDAELAAHVARFCLEPEKIGCLDSEEWPEAAAMLAKARNNIVKLQLIRKKEAPES